jgi:hypothetical protein
MENSAVEWLFDQIENEGKCIYEVIEQAKEMEKEQIMQAFANGKFYNKNWANRYYNETFKSEYNGMEN